MNDTSFYSKVKGKELCKVKKQQGHDLQQLPTTKLLVIIVCFPCLFFTIANSLYTC